MRRCPTMKGFGILHIFLINVRGERVMLNDKKKQHKQFLIHKKLTYLSLWWWSVFSYHMYKKDP